MFIPFEDIIFIEKNRNEILIHTTDEVHSVSQNLTELETVLNRGFLKVHKSYIVNLNKIEKLNELENRSYEICFTNYSGKAKLSRYKYEEFKKYFSPTI